jgi:hypothetical protein
MKRPYGDEILDYLRNKEGRWVSALHLVSIGGLRYGARIFELRRKKGLNIECKVETVNGTRHAYYRLMP